MSTLPSFLSTYPMLLFFFFFSIIRVSFLASSSPSLLRGVNPLDVEYFDAKLIKCKDGSNTFTKDRLNDDFCDCIDGTDEPGTSACPRGKFYCRDQESQPGFLFTSRINDHICDCCDGSDEFDGMTYCPNSCTMGAEIEYRAEYHQKTIARTVQANKSKVNGRMEDLVDGLKDLKVLAVIQLIIILWALFLFRRYIKSRR